MTKKKKRLNKLNPFYLPREVEGIRRLAAGAFGKIKKLAIDVDDYSDRQATRLLRIAEISVMVREVDFWDSSEGVPAPVESFWIYRCVLCNATSRDSLTLDHSESCPIAIERNA